MLHVLQVVQWVHCLSATLSATLSLTVPISHLQQKCSLTTLNNIFAIGWALAHLLSDRNWSISSHSNTLFVNVHGHNTHGDPMKSIAFYCAVLYIATFLSYCAPTIFWLISRLCYPIRSCKYAQLRAHCSIMADDNIGRQHAILESFDTRRRKTLGAKQTFNRNPRKQGAGKCEQNCFRMCRNTL